DLIPFVHLDRRFAHRLLRHQRAGRRAGQKGEEDKGNGTLHADPPKTDLNVALVTGGCRTIPAKRRGICRKLYCPVGRRSAYRGMETPNSSIDSPGGDKATSPPALVTSSRTIH